MSIKNLDEEVKFFTELLNKCGQQVRLIEEKKFLELISSPEIKPSQLYELFYAYIDSSDHIRGGKCSCDNQLIGKHFAKVVADKKFDGGWTALHHAVSHLNWKEQAVTALIEENEDILCAKNEKNQTSLSLATMRNANSALFLLQKYPKIIEYDSIDDIVKLSFSCKNRKSEYGDISKFLLDTLDSTSISQLVVSLQEKSCPIDIAVSVSDKLVFEDSTDERNNIYDLIAAMFIRNDMTSTLMKKMLTNINKQSHYLLTNKVHTDDFNILDDLSKIVDSNTKDILFSELYTNFLQQSEDTIGCGFEDGKNIAHYACSQGNHFLLSMIPKPQVDLMITLYDLKLRRPLFYSNYPMKIIKKIKHKNEIFLNEVCYRTGKTLIHHALTTTYNDEDFKAILNCGTEHLTKCDKYGNTVLHHMLSSSTCSPALLQEIVDRLKDSSVTVRTVNTQGYTPLHILCRFSTPDDMEENIKVLVEAEADVNANLVSHREVTAIWILKMRQYVNDLDDTNFKKLITKITSVPHYTHQDFVGNKELFDKLTFLNNETVIERNTKHGTEKFKIVNVIGNYKNFSPVPTNCIVIRSAFQESFLLFTLQHCNLRQTTVNLTAATLSNKLDLHKSLKLGDEELLENKIRSYPANIHIYPLHILILIHIRNKLGLAHVSVNVNMFQDINMFHAEHASPMMYMKIDNQLHEDFTQTHTPCTNDVFCRCLEKLKELGLLCILEVEKFKYVVHLPRLCEVIATEDDDKTVQGLKHALGIPNTTFIKKQPVMPLTHVLDLTLGSKAGHELNPALVFYPLWKTIAHVLCCDVYMSPEQREDSVDTVTLQLSGVNIQLSLKQAKVEVKCTDKQYTGQLDAALLLVAKQLQLQKLGENMVLKSETKSQGITKPLDIKKKYWLTNSTVKQQQDLLDYLYSVDHVYVRAIFGISTNHSSIKLDKETECMRLLYQINKRAGNMSLQQFYKHYKDTDKQFVDKVLAVYERDERYVETLSERCMERNVLWWSVTILISVIAAVSVIILSVQFDADIGFTGLTVIPAVVTVSYLLKKFFYKTDQGLYERVLSDADVTKTCGNLFA